VSAFQAPEETTHQTQAKSLGYHVWALQAKNLTFGNQYDLLGTVLSAH